MRLQAQQQKPFVVMQVRTYSKVFWKRFRELGDDQGEKYIKQIERGEQRIQRQQDIMDAIAAKMDRYRNPWQVSQLILLASVSCASLWWVSKLAVHFLAVNLAFSIVL